MKMTPDELNKWIKGVPVELVEDGDSTEMAGLDKDDCLVSDYPGTSETA